MKTVTVTWEQLGNLIGYDGPDEFAVGDQAHEQAQAWISDYEADSEDASLTVEQKDAVVAAIEMAIDDHWSVANVVRGNFDTDRIAADLNHWGRRGAQAAIYEGEMPRGDAVRVISEDDDGVTLELLPPFETVYAEAMYCTGGYGHEGRDLDSFTAETVVRVIASIASCEGGSLGRDLDLSRWDEARSKPRYRDLVKVIEEVETETEVD